MKAGFCIIPAEVKQDKELSWNVRGLFAEIEGLSKQSGFCWASNAHLAKLMDCKVRAIQCWLDVLESRGHIIRSSENGARTIIPFTSELFSAHAPECIPHASECTGGCTVMHGGGAPECMGGVHEDAPIIRQVELEQVNKTSRTKEGTHKARAPKVEVEPIFPSLEFREAWISFKLYRRREKKGWYKTLETEQTAIDGLMKRAGGDIPCIVDAIKVSIENRYTGIFPKPKHKTNEQGLTDQQSNLRRLILEGQAAGRGRPGGGHR